MSDYYDGKYAFFPEGEWETDTEYRFYNLNEDENQVCTNGIEGNPDEIPKDLYDVSSPIGTRKTLTRIDDPSIEIDGYVRKITKK